MSNHPDQLPNFLPIGTKIGAHFNTQGRCTGYIIGIKIKLQLDVVQQSAPFLLVRAMCRENDPTFKNGEVFDWFEGKDIQIKTRKEMSYPNFDGKILNKLRDGFIEEFGVDYFNFQKSPTINIINDLS